MSFSGAQSGPDQSDAVPAMSAQPDPVTGVADPRVIEDEAANAAHKARLKARMFGSTRAADEGTERESYPYPLGRYVVLERLGRGGMGTVLEAFDRTLDRRVAIKVLHADLGDQHRLRLLREAKALARLSHPNVVHVYEVDQADDRTFIAMELVRGRTLRAWLRQTPRPSWTECVQVFLQAGAGLAAAHAEGLVHRDFKPGNVIIDDEGRVRVLDFGLARSSEELVRDEGAPPPIELEADEGALDVPLTHTGAVLGTPAYMPLEQLWGDDAGARSDQFSFCASMYEALYGERPYAGETIEALALSLGERKVRPAPSGTTVPEPLRRIVLRGLASKPDERWPSMDALLEELRRLVAPRRKRWLVPLLAGVVLSSAVAIAQYGAAQQLEQEKAALAQQKDQQAGRAAAEAERAADEAEAVRREQGARASLLSRVPGRELEALALGVGAVGRLDEHEPPPHVEIVRGLSDALAQVHRVKVLPCDTYGMWAMAWSPDDTRLATTGWDGTARLRDGVTGEVVVVLEGHGGKIHDIAWSPDGARLATASADRTVVLWDGVTGEALAQLEGHTHRVMKARWSSDGTLLATASSDGTTRVWDGHSGEPLATLDGHTGRLSGSRWSPEPAVRAGLWDRDTPELLRTPLGDAGPMVGLRWSPWSAEGTRVTTARYGSTTQLWRGEAGTSLVELEGYTGEVAGVEWSPDDARVAVIASDGTPWLWDRETGTSVAALHGHSESIVKMMWSPNGKRLATTSMDGTARLWDGRTGEAQAALHGHQQRASFVTWSSDGRRLLTTAWDGTARLWDADAGDVLATLEGHTEEVMALAWSADGTRLASASWDGTARIWSGDDDQTGTILEGHEGPVAALTWLPGDTELTTASYDGTIRRWDGATGEQLERIEANAGKLWALVSAADGALAMAGSDGTVMLHDGEARAERYAMTGHTESVPALAWSPTGGALASASWDGTTRLWDGATGQPRVTLGGHQGWVVGLSWSPDGTQLATASVDGTARLWDPATGDESIALQGHDDAVVSVVWRPDGARLATASKDGTAGLWDGRTHERLASLEGHTKALVDLAWSPDGSRLATASEDGTARLWDGDTGELLAVFDGHGGTVRALAWTPDGARLATADVDGTVRLWPGSLRAQMNRACEILVGSTGAIELDAQVVEICG